LVCGWIRAYNLDNSEKLIFMQDGVPAYKENSTIGDFQEQNITIINWPAHSPDLNPMEAVWQWMKDWIQEVYWQEQRPTQNMLRTYAQEAWNAVTNKWLRELLASMPQRCVQMLSPQKVGISNSRIIQY
jgi:transposase